MISSRGSVEHLFTVIICNKVILGLLGILLHSACIVCIPTCTYRSEFTPQRPTYIFRTLKHVLLSICVADREGTNVHDVSQKVSKNRLSVSYFVLMFRNLGNLTLNLAL